VYADVFDHENIECILWRLFKGSELFVSYVEHGYIRIPGPPSIAPKERTA
jgi:hypothetical protein